MSEAAGVDTPARWGALFKIALAELLAMSLWFSASAVSPALQTEWTLSASAVSWLTLSVQLGFVVGTLASAFLNLPDVMPTRALVAACAWLAAAANAGLALEARGAGSAIFLRFLTGFFLAGVYPPGMKIMASWFRRGRGLALGVLIGALTLGKATPYLVNAVGSAQWRSNVLVVSALGAIGGLIMLLFVEDGPHAAPFARLDLAQITKVFRNRGVRLADFGYFGHMWELYAMWTWVPVFLRASFSARGAAPALAEAASFLVIGSGVAGCVLAGVLADRIGRTAVTDGRHGGVGGVLSGLWPALRRAAGCPPDRRRHLGRLGRRGLGAVLGLRDRALGPAVHGHGADDPDVRRVPSDDGVDRARLAAGRTGRLVVGVCGARAGARPGDPGHAAPPAVAGGGADRGRTWIESSRARAPSRPRARRHGSGARRSPWRSSCARFP